MKDADKDKSQLIKELERLRKENLKLRSNEKEYQKLRTEVDRVGEYYAAVLNCIADPVILKDRKHRWVIVNDAFCDISGQSRKALIGKSDYDIFPKNEADIFWKKDEEVFRTKRENVNEETITDSKNKITRTIITKKTLYRDFDGKEYVVAIGRDITDLKTAQEQIKKKNVELETANKDLLKAQEDLKQSEAMLKSIVAAAPTGIGVVKSRIFGWTNSTIHKMTGYSEDELRGKNTKILYPSEKEYNEVGEVKYAQIKEWGTGSIETKWKRKDGTVIDVLIRSTPINPNNLDDGVTFTALDITAHKMAEESLKESQRKLDSIFKKVPDIIYQLDTDGKITFINSAIKRYGYTQEELYGKSIFDIVHSEDRDKARYRINERRSGGRHTRNLEIRLLPKVQNTNQSEKNGAGVNLTPILIFEAEGIYDGDEPSMESFRGTQGIAHDVTERKSLENQLRQSQKMEAIGKLAGGIAHDFNNLLTAILGYSEIILMKPDVSQKITDLINEIKKSAERAAALTQQLLAFSRKQLLSPKVININDLIVNVKKMLTRLIGEDIKLVTKLDNEIGDIKADPGQIEQVIMNLAVNARDAMPKGGTLIIETQGLYVDDDYCLIHPEIKPGYYVSLSISDTGSGMDEETRTRVFDPFFTTKGMGKGTGLGLSTVYGIIKQSGGYIWVYSEIGKGSTFKIYLPRIKDSLNDEEKLTNLDEPLTGSETILVVEDEDALRKMACEVLTLYGYSTLEASDGKNALELIKKSKQNIVDLLLTDVIMPEMSGNELAKRLLNKYPRLKVLYISGYTDNAIVHHGILDKGISFLQKPFSPQALAYKIREVLDT